MLSAKGRKEESGVDTIVTLGLSFFCRSVKVAVGVGMSEFAGVVLVTHLDKINVETNRETAITVCLAIEDAMAFHAETATSGPTLDYPEFSPYNIPIRFLYGFSWTSV